MNSRSKLAESAAIYRTCLDKFGISQMAFADIIGVGRRTSQGYALGETSLPNPARKLLNLLIAGKVTLGEIGRA